MAEIMTFEGQIYSTTQNRGLSGVLITAYENGQKLGSAMSDGNGNFMLTRCKIASRVNIFNAVQVSQNLGGTNLSFVVNYAGGQAVVTPSSAFERNNALFVFIPFAYPEVNNTVQLDAQAINALTAIANKPDNTGVLNELKTALSDIAELTPTSGDSGGPSSRNRADGDLQATVDNAFTDVLGRNLNVGNLKTFTASLERAFPGEEQEGGKTKYSWNPRTYAVLSELGGGMSGAQASIYHQARSAWEDIEPLLNNLTPITLKADAEKAEAIRAILHTEMVELVNELGYEGGPRVQRVDYLFRILGDENSGVVKQLKDAFAIDRKDIITVENEEQFTNQIMIENRIEALKQSWGKIKKEFIDSKPKYFGTQLVLISRSLSVVADAVEETMNVMDSVGLGPSERKTLLLEWNDPMNKNQKQSILLGDLLEWVQNFARDEGPRLAVDGGIPGVEVISETAKELRQLVRSASTPQRAHKGFKRQRVKSSLEELVSHLADVQQRAEDVLP
jgi:hypothetical protein